MEASLAEFPDSRKPRIIPEMVRPGRSSGLAAAIDAAGIQARNRPVPTVAVAASIFRRAAPVVLAWRLRYSICVTGACHAQKLRNLW